MEYRDSAYHYGKARIGADGLPVQAAGVDAKWTTEYKRVIQSEFEILERLWKTSGRKDIQTPRLVPLALGERPESRAAGTAAKKESGTKASPARKGGSAPVASGWSSQKPPKGDTGGWSTPKNATGWNASATANPWSQHQDPPKKDGIAQRQQTGGFKVYYAKDHRGKPWADITPSDMRSLLDGDRRRYCSSFKGFWTKRDQLNSGDIVAIYRLDPQVWKSHELVKAGFKSSNPDEALPSMRSFFTASGITTYYVGFDIPALAIKFRRSIRQGVFAAWAETFGNRGTAEVFLYDRDRVPRFHQGGRPSRLQAAARVGAITIRTHFGYLSSHWVLGYGK